MSRVIEPFAGAAGYSTFFTCPQVVLVDIDPIICGVWRYLIGADADDIARLPELPEVGDCVDNYDLSDPEKWLIGFWLNRGIATPKKSRTAYSARSDRSQLNWGARAKMRIMGQLPLIRDWTVIEGSYDSAPTEEATWFVDPPYVDKGRFYRMPFSRFEDLGQWCETLEGQVIACEGPGATWLPFQPLGKFKTSLGFATEYVYLSP